MGRAGPGRGTLGPPSPLWAVGQGSGEGSACRPSDHGLWALGPSAPQRCGAGRLGKGGTLSPEPCVLCPVLQLLRRLLGERALQVERVLREARSPAELRARWDRLVRRAEAR